MKMSSLPWPHPNPAQSQLRLVEVPGTVLHALAEGQIEGAYSHLVTPYLAGRECIGLWRMRSKQIANAPADAHWVTRFVVVPGIDAPVGLAGFHGPSDEAGMVEVGYRIDPEHRRRGYARQALETRLAVARANADVRVIPATISPDNHASRSLVESLGFAEVGEQWDDEDGLEIILEVSANESELPTISVR